jgi:hypothetical protein
MEASTIERDLLALERRYWQAMKDQDVDGAVDLTDATCILTGAQGVTRIDKGSLASMLQDPPSTILDFDIGSDVQVRVPTEDTAIVAYSVHEELIVEGQPVTIDAADASTWVRRKGHWRCALHTESIAGDPFGRDRNTNSR